MTGARKYNGPRRSALQRFAAAPHIAWAILFVIAPLIFVAYYAFTDSADGSFTAANIAAFFTKEYLLIFWRSVKLAFFATLICLLLGYPTAYFISRCKPSTQKILIVLLMLPMWTNFLIRTYSIMTLLQDTGILNSLLGVFGLKPISVIGTETAVVIGMVYDYLPYMILPIYSVMSKMDYRLIEAASDLGCNGFQVLRKVIIPLSISGIISGITMVFMPAVTTFAISRLLGGGKFMLIGDLIEQQFTVVGDWNFGSAISIFMMIIILISMAVMSRFEDESDKEGGGLLF